MRIPHSARPYGKVTVLHGESGYDADGQVTEWDEDAGGSDWANEILYAGYRHDPETSLYHVRRRMYHPTLGRWLQRDPLGYVDGMSLYEYVGGAPLGAQDPMGLLEITGSVWDHAVAAGEAVVGIALEPLEGLRDSLHFVADGARVITAGTTSLIAYGVSGDLQYLDLYDEVSQGSYAMEATDALANRMEYVGEQVSGAYEVGGFDAAVGAAVGLAGEHVPCVNRIAGAIARASESGQWTRAETKDILQGAGQIGAALYLKHKADQAAATSSEGVRSASPPGALDTIAEGRRITTYYPPNRGFAGTPVTETLQPGAMIDRFGTNAGRFASPAGTPVPMRSLPHGAAKGPYSSFRVLKPIDVQSGTTAPWFGQPGGGTQYQLPQSVQSLLQSGHLERASP